MHVYNTSLKGDYAEKSRQIATTLSKQSDAPDIVQANALSALYELRRLHFPIAPVNIRPLIAQATIALANSGSPAAAAPYARILERFSRNDEVIVATCRSIQYGVALQAEV